MIRISKLKTDNQKDRDSKNKGYELRAFGDCIYALDTI